MRENEKQARLVGASFLLKDSPTLLEDLRQFMVQYFSFGDFVFRTADGAEVGRAHDLKTLEEQLHLVPEESIRYHGERNHFSNWLKARTEFWLAHRLRPRKVSDYPSVGGTPRRPHRVPARLPPASAAGEHHGFFEGDVRPVE